MIVGHDGLVYANQAAVRLLGYDSALDLYSKPTRTLLGLHLDRASRPSALRALALVRRREETHLEEELSIRSRDGRDLIVRFYYDAVTFEEEPCVLLTARDVSLDRALQEKVGRSERMASIGALAAGVAHEINNPLAYVTTNIAYCVERLRYVDELLDGRSARVGSIESLRSILRPMSQALAEAHDGTTRVATIVRDLRALTREDNDQISPVFIPAALDSAIHMSESEYRYRARLVRDFGDARSVSGNETRVVQVFLNLIVNAAQAFESEDVDDNSISVRAWTEGAHTIIEVEDNGVGIPEPNRDRIFLPFFTTKPVGVGTGLGLSICHGLVDSMKGTLTVTSELGRGSCFRVTLPTCDQDAPHSARRVPSTSPAGRARLLVVDDEPLILRSVSRLLRDQHDVEIAANGREALERIRDDGPFDLVVCDLMMPIMTGMELHAAVRAFDPEAARRFVFLTGGAFTEAARRFLGTIDNPTLDKPVQPNLLRSVVSGVLRS